MHQEVTARYVRFVWVNLSILFLDALGLGLVRLMVD